MGADARVASAMDRKHWYMIRVFHFRPSICAADAWLRQKKEKKNAHAHAADAPRRYSEF
jgi:hypothetical protein